MSKTNDSRSFYEQSNFGYVERAILAEPLSFSSIKDLEGKFYLPVMTVGMDKPTKAAVAKVGGTGYSAANYITLTIPAYMLFGFLKGTSKAPATKQTTGIVNKTPATGTSFNFFSGSIPKGTIFLVEFLGGEFSIDKTCIVGVLPNNKLQGD